MGDSTYSSFPVQTRRITFGRFLSMLSSDTIAAGLSPSNPFIYLPAVENYPTAHPSFLVPCTENNNTWSHRGPREGGKWDQNAIKCGCVFCIQNKTWIYW